MRNVSRALLALGLALVAACATPPGSTAVFREPSSPALNNVAAAAPAQLRLASWNIAHLQATPDIGCHPRAEATFTQMRQFVRGALNADIVALEEVRDEAGVRRVFPADEYDLYLTRANPEFQPGPCGAGIFRLRDGRPNPDPRIQEQRVGLAIRRSALGLDHVQVRERSEFAVLHGEGASARPVRAALELTATMGGRPIALLAVHLKSSCHEDTPDAPGRNNSADCVTLFRQAPLLAAWIREQEVAGRAYVVLGDFNRRIEPANAATQAFWDLVAREVGPGFDPFMPTAGLSQQHACRPQMDSYIDHFVIGASAERLYAPGSFSALAVRQEFSDHCPIVLTLSTAPQYNVSLGWVRNAAAYAALARETYARAQRHLPSRFSAGEAVVMDADETILDNTEYQAMLERRGIQFSEPSFTRWIMRGEAGAVPGALSYLRAVAGRGGRIIVITNRRGVDGVAGTAEVERVTRENIARLYEAAFSAPFPHAALCVLARSGDGDDKIARRRLVAEGALDRCDGQSEAAAWSRAGGYTVLAFVGDQPGDFPCFSEADGAALRDERQSGVSACDSVVGSSRFEDLFERKYFLLPQPLYGSWRRTAPSGG